MSLADAGTGSFADALAAFGLQLPHEPLADGHIHRVDCSCRPGHGTPGWYRLARRPFLHGWFGCWRCCPDEGHHWSAKGGAPITPEEREHLRQSHREHETDELRRHEETAVRIRAGLPAFQPAGADHPYLVRKKVGSHALRETELHGQQVLVVPLYDVQGAIWNSQFIYPEKDRDGRDKFFEKGGRVRGLFFPIGEWRRAGTLVICEGFATGAAIHEATGFPVLCAMNCGNLPRVAKEVRKIRVDTILIIAADDDAWTRGNPGETKAREAARAVGGVVAIPRFKDKNSKPTDFNDLLVLEGAGEVKRQIEAEAPSTNGRKDIQRLTALPRLEYELERPAAAKRLGRRKGILEDEVPKLRHGEPELNVSGQAVVFNEPEPWPDPVNLYELLDEIAVTFGRHVILPTGAADVLAVWCVYTWCADSFDYSPVLHITAPERQCGKSLVRDLSLHVVFRPLSSENASSAYLFRIIQRDRPTLFLDEFDNVDLETRKELIAIINSGYHRNGSVGRTVGKNHEPRNFSTYCPKMLIGIGNNLPDSTNSRCITITLRRKLPTERVHPLRRFDGTDIRRRCRRWADDNCAGLKNAEPVCPEWMDDRQRDVLEPLLAVVHLAGGHWPQRIREGLRLLMSGRTEATAPGTMILADIRDAFGESDRMSSDALLGKLNALSERTWPAYNRGKGLSPRNLAKLLKPYGIESRSIKLPDKSSPKGFHRDQFEDAFERYLPPSSPTKPKNEAFYRNSATEAVNTGASALSLAATNGSGGGYKSSVSPNEYGASGGVAAEKPNSQGETDVQLQVPPPDEEGWR